MQSSASFFLNAAPATEISTLSLHDALPISNFSSSRPLSTIDWSRFSVPSVLAITLGTLNLLQDRKSTRLNSSHRTISYAVFCLKKKRHRRRHHGRGRPHARRPQRECE